MFLRHAVAVGHARLRFHHVGVRQREIIRHDIAQVQDVRSDGVDLFGAQCLGCIPRHRAVDVVPQRGQGGDLHQGGALAAALGQAGGMPGLDVLFDNAGRDRGEHFIRFAKHAVAGSAFALPYRLALGDAARALGQAFEIRAHVDVPGLDLGRCGGPANALKRCGLVLLVRGGLRQAGQRQPKGRSGAQRQSASPALVAAPDAVSHPVSRHASHHAFHRAINQYGHCPPRHWRRHARFESHCCDKSMPCRALPPIVF